MMFLLATFFSSLLLSSGIILIRKSFYKLGENTLSLLNVLLDNHEAEEVRQKQLITNLLRTISTLCRFLIMLALVLFVTFLPFLIYVKFNMEGLRQLDTHSNMFWVVFLAGTTLPFLWLAFWKPKSDYNELSMLLHRMMLDNSNVALHLYKAEKVFFKRKTQNLNPAFVVVSGLARSGTTGLTSLLYESDKFYSLSYANMPFLMNPNSWRLFYKPQKSGLKERSHGDKVMFGFDTVEALEEFFFKVQLKNHFISEESLTAHEVDTATYREYLIYQSLLKPKNTKATTYLAKNNNLLLRYGSLRTYNQQFIAVFLFRNPVEHAYSLLKQHRRFVKQQTENPFVLEYMNWLGHHEFGLNHKHFTFVNTDISNTYDPGSINYWLCVWINYYAELLQFLGDKNLYLLRYNDFLHHPEKVIAALEEITQENFGIHQITPFENTNKYTGDIDAPLGQKAADIFDQLRQHQMII